MKLTEKNMNKEIEKSIEILKNWIPNHPDEYKYFIRNIYFKLEKARHQLREGKKEKFDHPIHVAGGLDTREELIEFLVEEIGENGTEELIIYLLENDHSLTNTDTFKNYQNFKPYPSYLVYYAYILMFDYPKGSTPSFIYTCRLFDIFWEYQAKRRPGIDFGLTEYFLRPFIDSGAITLEELQEIAVRDWYRWQEHGSPYYGPCHYFCYQMYPRPDWFKKEKELESEWLEKTGKKAKYI